MRAGKKTNDEKKPSKKFKAGGWTPFWFTPTKEESGSWAGKAGWLAAPTHPEGLPAAKHQGKFPPKKNHWQPIVFMEFPLKKRCANTCTIIYLISIYLNMHKVCANIRSTCVSLLFFKVAVTYVLMSFRHCFFLRVL